jgi:DNA-binding HxlR family transcriptional regulator
VKRTDRRSDCPVNFALQAFGDAWSLLVIRDLMFTGRRTFSEFLGAEEAMANNILSQRLRHLQDIGLIRRAGRGRGATYALTARGLDLLPAMLEIVAWSARHDPGTAAPPAFVRRIRTHRDALIAELTQELRARYAIPPRRRPRARR